MKSFRTTLSLSLVALVAALAGCGVEAGGAEAESADQALGAQPAAAAETAAATAPVGVGFRHFGGPGSLLRAALHEDIGLSAEQKATLTALVPERDAKARPQPDASRGAELAAAIRSGKVESLKLASPPQPSAAEIAAHQADEVKALQTLHDTLTATQRAALVAAVQKHEQDGPGHEPHAKGGRGARLGGPMGGLLKDLELTEAQKAQLETKLAAIRPTKPTEAERAQLEAKRATWKAEHAAKLQTFADASFDASAFVARPAKPEGEAVWVHRGPGDELAAVVSVLDATQREQLAKRVEAGPQLHDLKR